MMGVMRKYFALLLSFCLVWGYVNDVVGNDVNRKMGVRLRMLLNHPDRAARLQKSYEKCVVDGRWIKVFIEGESASSAVIEAGGIVETSIGKFLTARIPIDGVLSVALSPRIRRIRMARPVRLLNDRATQTVRADIVHAGQSPLSQAYSGGGVIVGIVDSGIDIGHDDFRKADGTTRILNIWDQNAPRINPPAGFNDGREWTKAQIDAGLCTHTDAEGHGTHVTGTATGNGRAVGNYGGMAPEADLIVVSTDMTDAGIVNGADYIFRKAEALGKPCVVNLSLGGHEGPHDGTGLFSRMLNQLIVQKQGRILCAAAGNEGGDFLHLTYPSTNDSLWTYYYSGTDGIIVLYVRIPDAFLNTVRFAVGVDESDYNPMTETGGPQNYLGRTPWYSAQNVIDAGWGVYEEADYDGWEHGRVSFEVEEVTDSVTALLVTIEDTDMTWDESTEQVQGLDLWRFMVWGGNPRIHVWVMGDNGLGYPYLDAVVDPRYRSTDNYVSVGMPADGSDIIAVGASVNRIQYTSADGQVYGGPGIVGDIAGFSSMGPTVDGRIKPEIVAPGSGIISSASQQAIDEGNIDASEIVAGGMHAVFDGTSMSCPVVAGCVALYLQQNPEANHQQVLAALKSSARQDGFTGFSLPDNTWGWGKIDVFSMLTTTGIPEASSIPLDFVLEQNVPNPFNSETVIRYRLPAAAHVRMVIYDALGREMAVLVEGMRGEGTHSVVIDGEDWGNGVYVCRLESQDKMQTLKMLLIK